MEPQHAPHDPTQRSRSKRTRQPGAPQQSPGWGGSDEYTLDVDGPLDHGSHPPPAAPEVPRGPPISYRQYDGDMVNQLPARSFSQRAKGQLLSQQILYDDDWEEEQVLSQRKREKRPEGPPEGLPEKQPDILPRNGKPILNGVEARKGDMESRRVSQPDTSTDESPQSTSTVKRDRPHSLRHSGDIEPLRIDHDSPTTQPAVRSANSYVPQHRDQAFGRSPLQTLEVKLNDISKAEKRAKMVEAEMALRDAKAGRSRSTRDSQSKRTKSVKQSQPIPEPVLHRDSWEKSLPRDALNAGIVQPPDKVTRSARTREPESLPAGYPTDRRSSAPTHNRTEDPPIPRTLTKASPTQIPQPSPTFKPPSRSNTEPVDDVKTRRLQKDVRRAGSGRQAPIAQSIPSNITRAVSLQQRQPPPVFPEDREMPRSGPLRESNASHKAVLAEPPVKQETRKLQKPLPGSLNRGSFLDPDTDQVVSPRKTAAVGAAALASVQASEADRDSPVQFFYRGMPQKAEGEANPQSNNTREVQVEPVSEKPRRASVSFKVPFDRARPINEWKGAGIARLTQTELALDEVVQGEHQPWWEQDQQTRNREVSQASDAYSQHAYPSRVEFNPSLYLKCGPLLRYTGIREDHIQTESGQQQPNGREYWRGSVMIVTRDSLSSYAEIPTLRLYSQPRDLLPPPPDHVQGDELAPEHVDPIAGLTKLSRQGRSLFVKPIDHLEEGKDLSQIETEDGLFESSPSPLEGAKSSAPNDRTKGIDGEALGKFSEVQGARLYADLERDVTFWRFNLEVELGDQEAHIAYRINRGPPVGFWVPAKGQSMNIMFHSCNGFSLTINPDQFGGPDPLWRDVLNNHQSRPFHVMIGGGDQLYNDRAMTETKLFANWTHMRNPVEKNGAPFSDEMRHELESFYLDRYSTCFSTGLWGMANSQIPMVNIYDDHDIIDGFGSYPDHFQKSPVFMGIGNVAFKYYMLFQHQSVPEETHLDEPSWVLGKSPGPYIQQRSRHVFVHLGRSIAFLGLDCRTERQRYSVLTDDTYDVVLDRCRKEIQEGRTKHLLVLLGVPIAYPRLVWLENILTSRAMAPVKALGRAGYLKGGFLNRFEGGVEVLDDLDDHWTATGHKDERRNLILDLQDLAAEKSVRITILGGDVHLAGIGQFFSDPKLKISKQHDHRYMPNVISSAIVNTPPPEMLADTLNKRNKTHRLDQYTLEDMIPMFTHDVDGRRRNNKRLLPRRNYCTIREYHPGTTPAPTPPDSPTPDEESEMSMRPRRRLSLSREDINPRNLMRRLSQRAPPTSYRDEMRIGSPTSPRRASHDGRFVPMSPQTAPPTRTSFPQDAVSEPQTAPASQTEFASSGPVPRPGILRRPTNLSEKAAKKGGPPSVYDSQGNLVEDFNDHINLESGLDITLNCEVHQGDPAGITTPYRFLVPTLLYDGTSDTQKLDAPAAAGLQRRPTLLNKLGFGRQGDRRMADTQGEGNWGQQSSEEESMYEPKEEQFQNQQRPRAGSISGGLKRFFSGRRTRYSDDEYEYSPNADDRQPFQQGLTHDPVAEPPTPLTAVPSSPPAVVQTSPEPTTRRGIHPATSSLQSTPSPMPSPTRSLSPSPSIEEVQLRRNSKAARLLGVDVSQPSAPNSRPAPSSAPLPTQPTRSRPLVSNDPAHFDPTPAGATIVNASAPLPPPNATSMGGVKLGPGARVSSAGRADLARGPSVGQRSGFANFDLGGGAMPLPMGPSAMPKKGRWGFRRGSWSGGSSGGWRERLAGGDRDGYESARDDYERDDYADEREGGNGWAYDSDRDRDRNDARGEYGGGGLKRGFSLKRLLGD